MIALIITTLTLIFFIPPSLMLIFGIRKLRLLHTFPKAENNLPTITLVVAVLNEENHIQKAVSSWLKLDYPDLEIIIVNDRSTDNTGAICNHISNMHHRVQVIHVARLPDGWLGKNHALHCGAKQVSTDYILFTDGDVSMHPSTLKRAIKCLQDNNTDHLCTLFNPQMPTKLLDMIFLDFWIGLCGWFKPWKAQEPGDPHGMGIGAFNLIHRQKYEDAGGHKAIKLSIVDDIALGIHLKQQGLKQECLNGMQLITVPWYDSLRDMIYGLSKNSFAGLDFSITKVLLASLFILLIQIWPWWGLCFYNGVPQLLDLIFLSWSTFIVFITTAHTGISRSCLIWLPVSPYLRLIILINSVVRNIYQKGIFWRGTYYPLTDLKKAHRYFKDNHN